MKKDFINRGSSVVVPVLVGGTIGAGLALLMTPKPGKAIRKDLNRFATQARDQVGDAFDKGADLYEDTKSAVTKAMEAGKERFDVITGGKKQSLVGPIIAGGIIGAGVALLFAPKSGRELRHDLSRIAANTRDQVATAIDKGKDLYEDGKSALSGAVEAGKKVYYEGKEKLRRAA